VAGAPANTTAPGDLAAAVALCQEWMDNRQDSAVRDGAAERLRPLMATIDRPNGIPAFCRKLLDPPATPPAAPATADSAPAVAATSPGSTTAKTTTSTAPESVTVTATAKTKNVNKPKNHG
jgi:hypothetical protein